MEKIRDHRIRLSSKGLNTRKAIYYLMTILFLLSVSACYKGDNVSGTVDNSYVLLKNGFENPDDASRAKVYWWWLNGHVDTLRMRTELKAIKDAGLGGVDIFDIGVRPSGNPNKMIPAGPAFMQGESLMALKFALKEAAELDLEVGLSLSSSWNAGGSWVEPKYAAKTIYYSKMELSAPNKNKIILPFPRITQDKDGQPRKIEYSEDGKPAFYKEISVIAIPSEKKELSDTTGIVNITRFFNPKNERLDWEPNKGKWDIYRFISSNSGEQLKIPSENSKGPIIDHFDSTATRMHLEYFIDRLQPMVDDLSNSALKYLYLASYEAKEFAWTSSFPKTFKQINGYDVHKFLPSLFVPQIFDSLFLKKFNHDYAKTFSEMMIKNHYGKAKEICNQYGLKICSEAGGPGHMHHIPVETLKALGTLDVPRGEFWYNRPYYKDSVDMVWLVKEIAAASHIYKKGLVEQEAFTSYWDWQESPSNLKPYADRAFAEGMNKMVIHGFPHNPSEYGYPGIAYFAGTHYNDKRVWWPKVKPFNNYLARVSYLLQNTEFVADVLYYYGEEIPNLVTPKNTPFAVGKGYDYEVINTDLLLNELTAENGKLVLPGVSKYSVLYVSEVELSLKTIKKLGELAAKGAIIVGKKPTDVIGLTDGSSIETFTGMTNYLWKTPCGNSFVEKGKIDSKRTPLEALASLKISPDFDYSDNNVDQRKAPIDFIHYKKANLDFYFIRNTTDKWVTRNCYFRQQNKAPEIWDPVAGNISPITIYEQKKNQTILPLTLAPYGSYFVVFKGENTNTRYQRISVDGGRLPRLEYTSDGIAFYNKGTFNLDMGKDKRQVSVDPKTIVLDGSWNISFPENWGAPKTANFSELISWTESKEEGIRYFSGTATYHKTFDFKKGGESEKVYLNLGKLAEVGEVWLNDTPLGITWTQPHRFDISDLVTNGKNMLKIEVANTWSNRLTGDAVGGEKFTQTNIVMANKNGVPWEDLPLKESGLLGPVTLELITPIK